MAVCNLKFKTAYYSETGRVVSRGGEDSVILPGIIEEVIPPLSIRTFLINDGYLSSESSRASFTPTGWEYVTDKR
jgi:hypothetical protein